MKRFALLSFYFCLSHDNQSSVTFMLIDICFFNVKQVEAKANPKGEATVQWENCEDQIDLAALSLKEPILFYDEVGHPIDTNTKHMFLGSLMNLFSTSSGSFV